MEININEFVKGNKGKLKRMYLYIVQSTQMNNCAGEVTVHTYNSFENIIPFASNV